MDWSRRYIDGHIATATTGAGDAGATALLTDIATTTTMRLASIFILAPVGAVTGGTDIRAGVGIGGECAAVVATISKPVSIPVANSVTTAAAETALVVEDEILIRMVISEYLRDCGYKVIEAANARQDRTYDGDAALGVPLLART